MVPEYGIETETVCLAVIPMDGGPVVTHEADPATLTEPPVSLPPSGTLLVETPCQINSCVDECTSGSIATIDGATTDRSTDTVPADATAETNAAATVAEPAGFESVLELVMEAADSVREMMTPCLTAHGLNDARFTIMRAIRDSRNGECSQSELARCLKQSEANVSTLLDRMRGDGLVSREKSPFDRRRSVVRLTEKGEQQLVLTEQDYLSRARGVLRGFEQFEVQSFRNQLRSFISIWEAELEHADSNHAVAGRIGGATSDSNSEGTETRHAQAG